MFERYSESARKVMNIASRKAQAMNHHYFGTEHILLGLTRVVEGTGAKELEQHNITPEQVREAVAELVEVGEPMDTLDELPPTPEAKGVIEHSVREARELHHNYVGTEHILLGLLHVTNGIAAKALTKLGLHMEEVRREVQ